MHLVTRSGARADNRQPVRVDLRLLERHVHMGELVLIRDMQSCVETAAYSLIGLKFTDTPHRRLHSFRRDVYHVVRRHQKRDRQF